MTTVLQMLDSVCFACGFLNRFQGKAWMESLDNAVGYLNKAPGYCAAGKCHVFPIAVGEFGSRFTNPEDLAHLADLALYMNAQGAGNTGGHKAFNNW